MARWLLAATAGLLVVILAIHLDASATASAFFGAVTVLGIILMIPDLSSSARADIGRALALGVLLGLMGTWLQQDAAMRERSREDRAKRVADVEQRAAADLAARQGLALTLSRARWLVGIGLRGADLERVYLAGKNLSLADLSGAQLDGATLRHANLRGAQLGGTDLSKADLTGADL